MSAQGLPVPADPDEHRLELTALGLRAEVRCTSMDAYRPLRAVYGALRSTTRSSGPFDLRYRVRSTRRPGNHVIERNDGRFEEAGSTYELIYAFEKAFTIDLQLQRPDLLFLHSAALEHQGVGLLLVAPSGTGKSTMTWSLLQHGFRYLSDELAPIEPEAMRVHPYSHALCLKGAPPAPLRLPGGALHTEHTIHVPAPALPSPVLDRPVPVAVTAFLKFDAQARQPGLRSLSAGEASARLYANGLNLLAHPHFGLQTVSAVAARCRCVEVTTTPDLLASTVVLAGVVGGG